MLQRIYGMNLGILCLLLLVVPIVWAKGCLWLRRNVQIRLNLLLLAAAVLAALCLTVFLLSRRQARQEAVSTRSFCIRLPHCRRRGRSQSCIGKC